MNWYLRVNKWYDRLPEPRRMFTFMIPMVGLIVLQGVADTNNWTNIWLGTIGVMIFLVIFRGAYVTIKGSKNG